MFLIGLCGRSGSGKSTVCKFLAQKGVYCIDADKVCHSIYDTDNRCVQELSKRFGKKILQNGKICRKELGKMAYSGQNGISDLNAITHKYIIAAILAEAKRAAHNGHKIIVVDAPMLFESKLNVYCNGIIAVIANNALIAERLKERDGIDDDMFKKRLSAQKDNEFLRNHCTVPIQNNGSSKSLRLNAYKAMFVLQLKLGMITPGRKRKRYVLTSRTSGE